MPVLLTDKFVASAHANKRANIADAVVPGLRLRISPSGVKSWAVYYRLRGSQAERLYTLGKYPDMSLGKARDRAREVLAQARLGQDPQGTRVEQRAAARDTTVKPQLPGFEQLCDDFVKDQSPDWRPATRVAWTRYIQRELKPALGKKPPEEIQPAEIRDLVDRIRNGVPGSKPNEWARRPAPVSAQRAYEVLRRVFAWAVWKGRVPFSPCEQAKPFERAKRSGKAGRLTKRAKAYSNEQLQKLFAAAEGTEIGPLMSLIARTGVRSHEARSARWEDFDLTRKTWSIPPEMQKTGTLTGLPHLVPLSKGLLDWLRPTNAANQRGAKSPWLFPAPTAKCEVCNRPGHMDKPNKATAAVKKAAGLLDRGLLHRFRDTLKTRLSEHGVDGRVSEHILGHAVPGIAGVYDHAELLPQRRDALVWWDQDLRRILKAKRDRRQPASQGAAAASTRGRASQTAAPRRTGRRSPSHGSTTSRP